MRASILTLALSLTLIPATLQAQSGPNNFPTWVETYHQVIPDPAQYKWTFASSSTNHSKASHVRTTPRSLLDERTGRNDVELRLFGNLLASGSRQLDMSLTICHELVIEVVEE